METPTSMTPTSQEWYLLRKLIVQHASEVAPHHAWVWEHDRWKELVFAIIAKSCRCGDRHARVLTEQLDALGLLSIPLLAGATTSGDAGHLARAREIELLEESGCSASDAAATLGSIIEAARFFATTYQGRVQKLFRKVGETLLAELKRGIAFSNLSSSDADYVMVHWMQNVLGLPLSLRDEQVAQFASDHALSVDGLIEAADEMGVNMAFLDDLINFKRRAVAITDGD